MEARSTELLIEAFGVRASVRVGDPALVEAVKQRLPPGWMPAADGDVRFRAELRQGADGGYELVVGEEPPTPTSGPELAIEMLDAKLRLAVAEHAPEFVFIHAGVVAANGRALVLPGRTFTGKTTLVEALLRAGATYYSDEYAVLDSTGHVHAYPKPLSVRPPQAQRVAGVLQSDEVDPGTLGAATGTEPIPIGLIACATYRAGERWEPEPRSPAESALALLQNAVAARTAPERVLSFIQRAVGGLSALEGFRGEADETAGLLLSRLADS